MVSSVRAVAHQTLYRRQGTLLLTAWPAGLLPALRNRGEGLGVAAGFALCSPESPRHRHLAHIISCLSEAASPGTPRAGGAVRGGGSPPEISWTSGQVSLGGSWGQLCIPGVALGDSCAKLPLALHSSDPGLGGLNFATTLVPSLIQTHSSQCPSTGFQRGWGLWGQRRGAVLWGYLGDEGVGSR